MSKDFKKYFFIQIEYERMLKNDVGFGRFGKIARRKTDYNLISSDRSSRPYGKRRIKIGVW
jgi:hypothetical protein